MRIDVQFQDRVGIAHEILAVLAARGLNVVAVEVEPPHVYIDAPELAQAALPELAAALVRVSGVRAVAPVDLLPGVRRQLHLDVMLAALADPVLAVDACGAIVTANAAASAVAGVAAADLCALDLARLFGDAAFQAEVLAAGFRAPAREVLLGGQPFLADSQPILDEQGRAVGGVLTLQSPARIGERLDALQNFPEGGFDLLIGDSDPMRALKARAARVAVVDAALLIVGETGTGKELIAHACHRASARRERPFLALNCAALPESLAESELYGYAPGAFSGAQRGGKPGLLELADHGTVFLDEVGEMSAYLQAKLLRFLNDGSFRRVGGGRESRVDVRIVAATHRDLERMVAEGSFREDLYYRLNVLGLRVPPLRERGEDILLLALHFIARACAQTQRAACRLTARATGALLANPWPGNVRQLENVIFRAVTLTDGALLDAPDLELANAGVAATPSGAEVEQSWSDAVSAFERGLLARLYPHYPSSRKLAGRLRTSHTTIANKLRKYGIAGLS